MSAYTIRPGGIRPGDPALAARLRGAIAGDVLWDAFDRGRYSTDASIYQVEPLGVVRPRSRADIAACLAIAREEGISVIPRGGGTSQAGQTVGRSLVMDNSRWLTGWGELDEAAGTVWVEPGIVLDELNRALRPTGLFYPVDVSTSSRATLGGMTANNSCGSRSLRYGVSVDNVLEIEALLPSGELCRFGEVGANLAEVRSEAQAELVRTLMGLATQERDAIERGFPKTARQVGGYNLPALTTPGRVNLASLLVGSEGTLAYFTRIKLRLHRRPRHTVMGVCHFPTFRRAMAATPDLVALGPTCVELVDRSILDLARGIPAFAADLPKFVRGQPEALLLVEFAGEAFDPLLRDLARLEDAMAALGLPGGVVQAREPALQATVTQLRTAGLNIAMSMKGDGKPVSFIEDCAVPLEHLPDYTAAITELFARAGTSGTWYAHAAVGCLHVRPILNLKQEKGVAEMRAIAEAAIALVQRFKGAHSGEHGDGLVRSEWHERVFGPRLVRAFEAVKDAFDPTGVMNAHPSKIVRAPAMSDRGLLRYPPGYAPVPLATALDWGAWGGMLGAAEMCNNNGHCRQEQGGVMCPSYRATRDEEHVTRGRANVLRLALSGQLGADALHSPAMHKALDLCISCKACRRECPTGVDLARMKIEVVHQWRQRQPLSRRERLTAYLPRWAPALSRLGPLLNLRDRVPGLPQVSQRLTGFSARRRLPHWHPRPWTQAELDGQPTDRPPALLFVDTFTRWFEPEQARAAVRVLTAMGWRAVDPTPQGERPLCCGRTFMTAGLVEEARAELRRLAAACRPWIAAGAPLLGLEPSCTFTMKDELLALLPPAEAAPLADATAPILSFVAARGGDLALRPLAGRRALVHGHCHEKAFAAFGDVQTALRLVPGLEVAAVDSSCCGMAGAFGYEAEHHALSLRMAELDLLPAVRAADAATVIVADGTSCRHQIRDGTGRPARHAIELLAEAVGGRP